MDKHVISKLEEINYTTDDFALASINLYLDVVNLFLFLLDLIGGNR